MIRKLMNMELDEIPIRHLHNLGFIELKPKLYRKCISENTYLYRDYRYNYPVSYAYFRDKAIDAYKFKETRCIEKLETIEKYQKQKQTLVAYT